MLHIEKAIIVTVTVIVAVAGIQGWANLTASKECLALGWPASRIDYTLTKYCIKRVDQTDIVKPLTELKNDQRTNP